MKPYLLNKRVEKILLLLTLAAGLVSQAGAQTCSTCGGLGTANSLGDQTGPSLNISLGAIQYGLTAGTLNFSSSLPDPQWFTPAALQLDAPLISQIVVVTNNDSSLRQINVPQALVDIPVPPTTNGYVVNFYYPSQISGVVSNIYQFTGNPFVTWMITNSNPSTLNQIQISETTPDGLLKQWTYNYSTNPATWTVQSLGGVEEVMSLTNLNSTTYQIANTLQYSNGPVVQQTIKTYQSFSWGVAPVEIAAGSASAPEITTYTYYDPSPFSSGFSRPVNTVSNPDGSWQWYAAYDNNGNPTNVYSSYGDTTLSYATNNSGAGARQTVYVYDPVAAGVSGSGDDGTADSTKPRETVTYVQGQEVSRSYAVFPSVSERLDIQCTVAGAAWNASGNLVTTNFFYTSGPNQFALQSVIRPDGTMTTCNYITNATYQTNITATGQPDPTCSYIVDGVSNVTVLNSAGYDYSATSYDILSGLLLSQDAYGNFDSYGRPQQVTHLDGTTEYTQYACCGLESTVNRDGATTVYSYDGDHRQTGYDMFYSATNTSPIMYQNTLDAAGRTVQSIRIGSDDSSITTSQSAYDLASEIIARTNALNGATIYTRTNDSTTGGLIRTIVNPDGGTITNFYYADGNSKKTVGTGVHGQAYGYGTGTDVNGNTCTYTVATNLNADGSLSSEWTKNFTDMAGRTTETLYADGHYSQSFYNAQGQLSKQIDPDGVTMLYQYNGKGELAYSAVDLNQNGSIDFSGSDRITQTTNDVITDHGTTVRRTRTYQWLDGQSTGTLISSVESSVDGLNIWQTQYRDTSTAVTSTNLASYGSGSRTVINSAPDGSYAINLYSYGRLTSATRYNSSGTQIGGTTYGYDAHGRQYQMTDARNGTTTLGFNNADLVTTNTTPNPGGGSPEVTVTTYNNLMQATSVLQPDSTTVSSAYLLTGELGSQSGSRTYPVGYSYDYAGRMATMTNWTGGLGGAGARVTTWNYDPYRGWLTSKVYADGHGPSYSYTAAGRLASRAWVRGVTTSYAYNTAGSLTNVSYSDGTTPGVTNSYDRLGRLNSVVCNGMTDTMTYNLANELLGESFSGGSLAGLAITNYYDPYLRRTNLTSLNGTSMLAKAVYGYDNASRLSTVSDGTNNAAYTYLANSPLVSQIVFKQSSTTRMTTAKTYDYLNRLTQVSSAPSASYTLPLAFNYNYNTANQRTHNTLADGSYWIYGYDSLGQVTNACKYFSDGTPVAGQQFDYTFDTIGNRTQTLSGGDQTGANLRTNNYYANNLNQVTNRDVAAYVDVMGASILTNVVTVNGTTAYRKQEYFRQQLAANNSSSALWTNVIVSGGQSVTGNVYVAKEPEVFKYDADGNLTNDGRWAYTWDGENRLIGMTNNTSVGPQYKLTFAYDSKGRRIQKLVSTNSVAIYTNRFLYDGWNLVAEVQPNNSLIRSYIWGNDLSGSMQGAGGVGGLLEVSYYGSSTTNCFPAFDGNGNVAALINAADGTLAANYDYGPFGEPIRVTGVMAKNNPFRFSTKYDDDESDLLYYGYRYYKPSTGTWPSKDPAGERGGLNLYIFCANAPIFNCDKLGLAPSRPPGPPSPIDPSKPAKPPITRWCTAEWMDPVEGTVNAYRVTCVIGVYYGSPPDQHALDACLSAPSKAWDTECARCGGPIRSRMTSICSLLQDCFKKYWPQPVVNE